MPDITWSLQANENVSAAVQRIGQALGGLDSTSSRAAGGLAAALGQAQTAATATAGAVQRVGAQPLRLTDQATPLLTQLRAELNRLAGPPPVVLTARDGITPLLAPLTTRLEHLPAPPAIPITARDDVAAVLQRITSAVQRLNITVPPIRIPAVAAPASPAASAQAAADPAGVQRLAQQAAAAQGAVQSLGTRLDTLQRQLAGIGSARPTITLTSNYQALQAEIATLQSRLTALSKQPYSVQVKTETAQVRADLAGLQRQFAGFKAELPPLAPKVDSGPVESALRRMQQGFAETGRAAQQHSGAVSSFFSNALSMATGFLAANVFSRITSGFADIAGNAVGLAGGLEQAQVGFTGLLHSGDAANAMLAQLRDFANKSPFRFTELQGDAEGLLGVGEAANKILPDLKDVGDEIAGRGLSQQQLQQTILAYEQVITKGHLAGQEALQFQNANIPIYQILATALGKSVAEIQALGEQGKITADLVQQAFHADAVNNFNGAMERQSRTWNGLSSTIQDVGETLLTSLGQGFIGQVEPSLARITDALQNPQIAATLEQWGAAAGQFAVGLINAGQTAFTVAQQIIQALQPVTDFIGQLFGISGQAAPAIKPPDLTGPALSAAQYSSNVAAAGPAAKSAGDQVKALEAQTRELSRATAEANVGYDARKQSLQDQLTLLDRQYQAENKAADVSSLQAKIAKDKVLAVNQYSSQGQAAASRLVDEEARLAQLQREQGHDATKNAIEDRIKSVDREKQQTDNANAAKTRAIQEQIDLLRAAASIPPPVVKPPTAATDEFKKQQLAVQSVADHVTDLGRKLGLLPASVQGQPKSMLDRLLGTQAEQIAAANAAANNMIIGFFDGIKGKATFGEFMQTMFGGASPFAAPEQWGADAARAVRQGLGLDTGKPGGEGKGPQSNATKAAADPANYTANPFDPSSYNPVDAIVKAAGRLSAQVASGAYANNALSATRPPEAMPLISGQNAQAQANTLTAQWRAKGFKGQYVFDRGHLVWVPEPGAARAEGGPVYAGQSYTVGERGPETLVMGTTSGRIVPNGGVQEHVFRFEFDNNGLVRVIDKRTGQVLQDALR